MYAYNIAQMILSGVVASCIVIVSNLIIHRKQINDSITSKTISCLTGLFSEYKEVMKKIDKALGEAKTLELYLKEYEKKEENRFSDFNKEYYSEKYANYREVHYFFELLGSLAIQKEIGKSTFWNYFTFPIDYFLKTKVTRELIRKNNCLPSHAESFCWLFAFYNDHRRKNKEKWISNGKALNVFRDCEVENYTGSKYREFREKRCCCCRLKRRLIQLKKGIVKPSGDICHFPVFSKSTTLGKAKEPLTTNA
jgi:hypothetical protein